MTRRMFRYTVPADDRAYAFDLSDEPVHVDTTAFGLAVDFWVEHDDTEPTNRRAFQVFGTGHELPDGAHYVGTCDRTPGGLVWHLFEVNL
jgi:hypothetical protein